MMSIVLYAMGTTYQLLAYFKKLELKPFIALVIGASAAILQLGLTGDQVISDQSLNLSMFNSASLFTGVIVISLLILGIHKPLHIILLAIYPLAIASLLGSLIANSTVYNYTPQDNGIFAHIALSVIAYCVLSIAAVQAVLIYAQNNNLKKKNQTILMRNLPPLLVMEKLLFEMLWSGTVLLGLAVIAGFIFVDNLFAQHLAHKSFFSILSLGVFSTLLYGRYHYGWRGIQASKLTLIGAILLMLGFFGSKFVLEWILN